MWFHKVPVIIVATLLLIPLAQATVLGFSRINVQSSYADLDKEVWVVQWVDDGFTSEYLQASITPQDFKQQTGYESGETLYIKSLGTNNRCEFDVRARSDLRDIYTIRGTTKDFPIWANLESPEVVDWAYGKCVDNLVSLQVGGWLPVPWITAYCAVIDRELGKPGEIINKVEKFDTKWSIQAGNKEPQTSTISNAETGVGVADKIGDNVWVLWTGSLSSGDSCPLPTNELASHSTDGWRVIDKTNYNRYITKLDDFQNLLYLWSIGQLSQSGLENSINTYSYQAIQEKPLGEYSVSQISTSYSSGKIKIDLDEQIIYPLFRLFVDSDYLTLIKPVGKPQIIDPTTRTIKFTEGDRPSIQVTVKNIGDGNGDFNVRVKDCTSEFGVGTQQPLSLAPNAQRTLTFYLVGSSTTTNPVISGRCSFEVKEITTGETVTSTFNIEMQQLTTCTQGHKRCAVENNLWVIKSCVDGFTESTIQTCQIDQTCEVVAGIPTCSEGGTPPPPPPVVPSDIDYELIGITLLVAVIVIFIAISYKKRKKKGRWYGKR